MSWVLTLIAVTNVPGEGEYLFTPYSVFTVMSVTVYSAHAAIPQCIPSYSIPCTCAATHVCLLHNVILPPLPVCLFCILLLKPRFKCVLTPFLSSHPFPPAPACCQVPPKPTASNPIVICLEVRCAQWGGLGTDFEIVLEWVVGFCWGFS